MRRAVFNVQDSTVHSYCCENPKSIRHLSVRVSQCPVLARESSIIGNKRVTAELNRSVKLVEVN
jgi:hypothetical protein